MRISLLFLGSTGAGPVYSLEMAKALAASRECKLHCIISERVSNLADWENAFINSDVKLDVVETYSHNKISFALNTLAFWKINRICRLIRDFKPDSLYVPFLLTWDFLIYPKLYKEMTIVSTLHDPHPHDTSSNPFSNWITKNNKKAYRYVNDVIILNNGDVQYVKENYCHNVHVIPHASFSYYVNDVDSDYRIKHTIGFLGRIEPYKGLDLLLDAFSQLDSEYKLIVAGSGKIDDKIYNKIKDNEKIELINRYIKDEEFTGLINRMDFVVLPYKRASQSGVIPLVFAHGKTVIATNVGALKEQVPEGTGMIVAPSVESLVSSIKDMYGNPSRLRSFGEKAKKYADTELTWASSAKKLLSIINQD